MYLDKFKEELKLININEFREFAVDAINSVRELYWTKDDIDHIKRVVKISRELCDVLECDDPIFDLFTVVGLIHIVCKYDSNMLYDPYHMIKVRARLLEFQASIGREQFNNIMLVVESQNGFQSLIPQVEPQISDPAHNWILPFSVRLAVEWRHNICI